MALVSYAMGPHWNLALRDMGIDSQQLLRRAGLKASLFSRGAVRVSQSDYAAFWRALAEEPVDVPVPITYAQSFNVDGLGTYVFAAMCCANLESAAVRMAQFKMVAGPTRIQVGRERDRVRFAFFWPDGMEVNDTHALVELLYWVGLARKCTGRAVAPVEVSGPLAPANPMAFQRYLGVPLTRAPSWSIAFTLADAALPFHTADEKKWRFIEPRLRQRLTALKAGSAFSARVRAALLELLPAGGATMDAVGAHLGMGKRTLQRRLAVERTTFHEVMAETRAALARYYLRSTEISLPAISFLLAYDDTNSFYRAFHTWTGMAPEAYRQAAHPHHPATGC